MSIFLDASAIVANLAREPEAVPFACRIEREPDRITSAVSVWEATRGLAKARALSFEEARSIVTDYLRVFDIRIVSIAAAEADIALDAHHRFGKGRQEAALNLGDCFTYACARTQDAELLFKGEDFIHTDLQDATLS